MATIKNIDKHNVMRMNINVNIAGVIGTVLAAPHASWSRAKRSLWPDAYRCMVYV